MSGNAGTGTSRTVGDEREQTGTIFGNEREQTGTNGNKRDPRGRTGTNGNFIMVAPLLSTGTADFRLRLSATETASLLVTC